MATARKAKNGMKAAMTSGVRVVMEGRFPLISHGDISLPPRPEPNQSLTSVFYNPRPLDEVLDAEKMQKLVHSIRVDDLLEPVAVNLVTDHEKNVLKVELLAGERRYHALGTIIRGRLPCVEEGPKPVVYEAGASVLWKTRFGVVVRQDGETVVVSFDDHMNDLMGKGEVECHYDDVSPTVSGDAKHELIPCKCYYNLTDERKMRIAFSENNNSEPLSAKAEVDLVERYVSLGKKLAEIAHMLGTNITFVSQRSSFRRQLPPEAFPKLMSGKMSSHVAIEMLSFSPEVRQLHFEAMVADEKIVTSAKLGVLREEKDRLEDEAEIHKDAAKKAFDAGDEATAAKEEKKAEVAEKQVRKVADRQKRVEENAGSITRGNAKRAAAAIGVTPRKKKMLLKEQVLKLYIEELEKYRSGKHKDPVCNEPIPAELVCVVSKTAKAIVEGQLDPIAIIREHKIETKEWTVPTEPVTTKTDPGKQDTKRRSDSKTKHLKRQEAVEDIDEEDEDIDEEASSEDEETEETYVELDDLDGPSADDLADEDSDDFWMDDEREDDEEEEEKPRRRKRSRRRDDDDDVGERLAFSERMFADY